MKKIEGYTKGPWQASKVKWAIDADDYVIARVCETRGDRAFLIHAPIGTEDEQDHDDDHGDANIALIASAPETYERCVALEEENGRMRGQIAEAVAILESGTKYEKMHLVGILKDGLPKGEPK